MEAERAVLTVPSYCHIRSREFISGRVGTAFSRVLKIEAFSSRKIFLSEGICCARFTLPQNWFIFLRWSASDSVSAGGVLHTEGAHNASQTVKLPCYGKNGMRTRTVNARARDETLVWYSEGFKRGEGRATAPHPYLLRNFWISRLSCIQGDPKK